MVAIVSVEAILSAEPQEPTLVLRDIGDALLREALRSSESHETDIASLDNRQTDDLRIDRHGDNFRSRGWGWRWVAPTRRHRQGERCRKRRRPPHESIGPQSFTAARVP